MTGLNHATTGIAIALLVKNPLLAPLIAFGSHFLLDMVPHFGHPKLASGNKELRWYIIAEAASMTLVTVAAMLLFPQQFFIIGLCAFVAFAPDIIWFFTYFRPHSRVVARLNRFISFSQKIQWYEKPPGLAVEAVYFVGLVWLIVEQYSGR